MSARAIAKNAVTDALPRDALLRLLAVMLVVLAPHVEHIPIWATALVLAVVAWRAVAALRGWRMLSTIVRAVLAIGAFAAVFATFGRVSGQIAGVALLVVMTALKLTELRQRRDVMVLVFLMYFLLITHFLFSQELWTAAYLIVCAVLITGVLVDANHPGGALPLRRSLRLGGRMIVAALPLMVVIFILFPRIPGPLWGLPSDSGAARSGLSDSMEPGDISDLLESDAVAFRVRFDGPPPPPRERYWRGPVLGHFNGRKWDAELRPRGFETPKDAELADGIYHYEVTLEPQRSRWLFALELPRSDLLPPDSKLNADYELLATKDVRERMLYHVTSVTHYRLQNTLGDDERSFYLKLPKGFNPRAKALAEQWRAASKDDAQVIDTALKNYRNEKFFYTLHPPKLGHDSVDEFLFSTHRGFCEHYASSFTVLMRGAGIPARVVTGYQGGEKNDVGDYYIVHQSEAHAWSEVWLEGRGWVRVDPTAAVAPERVERGVSAALSETDDLPGYLNPSSTGYDLRTLVEARWDWVNAQWNHWVLAYGPELQQDFLARLGLNDWSDMVLALTIAMTVILGLTGAFYLRHTIPRGRDDAALKLWHKLQRRLARAGIRQAPSESSSDFVRRIVATRPELARPLAHINALYLDLRYRTDIDAGRLQDMTKAISRLVVRRGGQPNGSSDFQGTRHA